MSGQQSWQVRCPACGGLSPVFTNVQKLEDWKADHPDRCSGPADVTGGVDVDEVVA